MFTIARETYREIIEDITPLLSEHWEEVAHYKDHIPLDPVFEVYQELEKAGKLFIVALREDGRLIGYSIYILNRHIHYRTCLIAGNDLLFLLPEKRGGSLGYKLIAMSDNLLTTHGVTKITYHIKPEHDFSPLLKKLGYMQEEIMYGKLIGIGD